VHAAMSHNDNPRIDSIILGGGLSSDQ
jgi:hypothetical protein